MAAEPSVCPACDGTETVPIHRVGNKWRYRCAACLATWVGKRRRKATA